ncbi:MAG: hypothetical protein K2N51_20875 [Lachnospiraceae bacterium]|nr:hypothetical protein [Lachnospiraceae bacterium]
MTKSEKKAMLINKMQEELDRRTEQEEEAIYLMEQGEFERANQLLKSIDDSVAKGIIDELDGLEEKETKEEEREVDEKEELRGIVTAILENEKVRHLSLKQIKLLPSWLNQEISYRIQKYNNITTFEDIHSLNDANT